MGFSIASFGNHWGMGRCRQHDIWLEENRRLTEEQFQGNNPEPPNPLPIVQAEEEEVIAPADREEEEEQVQLQEVNQPEEQNSDTESEDDQGNESDDDIASTNSEKEFEKRVSDIYPRNTSWRKIDVEELVGVQMKIERVQESSQKGKKKKMYKELNKNIANVEAYALSGLKATW